MTAAEKARAAQKANPSPEAPEKPERQDFPNHTRFGEAMDYYELKLLPEYHKAIERISQPRPSNPYPIRR